MWLSLVSVIVAFVTLSNCMGHIYHEPLLQVKWNVLFKKMEKQTEKTQ